MFHASVLCYDFIRTSNSLFSSLCKSELQEETTDQFIQELNYILSSSKEGNSDLSTTTVPNNHLCVTISVLIGDLDVTFSFYTPTIAQQYNKKEGQPLLLFNQLRSSLSHKGDSCEKMKRQIFTSLPQLLRQLAKDEGKKSL